MRWALTLSGEHVEGVEAKSRFDAIVKEFSEKLLSNGFLPGFGDSTLDVEGELDRTLRGLDRPDALSTPVEREAAKLAHPPTPVVQEPPREVLDRWVAEDARDLPIPPESVPEFQAGFAPLPTAEEVFEDEPKPVNVTFASDEAGELAIARGLTTRNFQGLEPSSENGFTIPDVKRAAKRAGK